MDKVITRVLLVEDEEDVREILEFYLNTVFDEVKLAEDGQKGLELFTQYSKENKHFDVIVTDIQMPNKNGLEMIEDITCLNEEQKFIIVSAYKNEEYLFKSIGLNVMSYFVKPLEVKSIMDILKKVKDKVLEDKTNSIKIPTVITINENYSYNTTTNLLLNKEIIVDLSKKETLLLQALLKEKEIIKTKEELKLFIWNDVSTSDVTLRTVIKRVKDKIKENDFIVSKKGKGYLIQ